MRLLLSFFTVNVGHVFCFWLIFLVIFVHVIGDNWWRDEVGVVPNVVVLFPAVADELRLLQWDLCWFFFINFLLFVLDEIAFQNLTLQIMIKGFYLFTMEQSVLNLGVCQTICNVDFTLQKSLLVWFLNSCI